MATYQNRALLNKSEKPAITFSDSIVNRIKGAWPKFSVELSAGEYGESIDQAEKRFGRQVVNESINVAKSRFKQAEVPSVADLLEIMHELNSANNRPDYGDVKHLYDERCADCDEGWMEVWFDDLSKKEQQRLVDFYGLEVARMHTQRKRCHCWKGQR